MGYRIDEIDKRILYHLVADARNTSGAMIAEKVDVTPATIRHRITQLEEHGVITGYHADIDYEQTDGQTTVEFTCTAAPADRQRLAQEVLQVSGVVEVRELIAGQQNLRITAVGSDNDDISRIARELSELGLTIETQAIVHDEVTQPYQPYAPDEGQQSASLTDFRSLAGGAEVVEFTVADTAPIAGQTLADANEAGILPDDVLVIGLERGETMLTPKGETTIQTGDVVTLFARESLPDQTLEAFETRDAPVSDA